jgi:Gly-Xaa carboxypeptidase
MQKKSQNYTLLSQGESDPLQPPAERLRWNRRRIWQWIVPGLLALTVVIALAITRATRGEHDIKWDHNNNLPACPQYPALKAMSIEREKLENEVKQTINSDEFFQKSLKNMQGAVQIPTESFDDMGKVGNDTRWDIFKEFHAYLGKIFPLV